MADLNVNEYEDISLTEDIGFYSPLELMVSEHNGMEIVEVGL